MHKNQHLTLRKVRKGFYEIQDSVHGGTYCIIRNAKSGWRVTRKGFSGTVSEHFTLNDALRSL